MLDHTLPFYVDHTMIMVEHPDELAFGVSVEPQKWVPSVDAWIERWKADRYALALIPPPTYDRLRQGRPADAGDRARLAPGGGDEAARRRADAPAPVEKPQQ